MTSANSSVAESMDDFEEARWLKVVMTSKKLDTRPAGFALANIDNVFSPDHPRWWNPARAVGSKQHVGETRQANIYRLIFVVDGLVEQMAIVLQEHETQPVLSVLLSIRPKTPLHHHSPDGRVHEGCPSTDAAVTALWTDHREVVKR